MAYSADSLINGSEANFAALRSALVTAINARKKGAGNSSFAKYTPAADLTNLNTAPTETADTLINDPYCARAIYFI